MVSKLHLGAMKALKPITDLYAERKGVVIMNANELKATKAALKNEITFNNILLIILIRPSYRSGTPYFSIPV